MMLIRMYEERAALLQRESGAPGSCTAVGQEATAVGVVAALGVVEHLDVMEDIGTGILPD